MGKKLSVMEAHKRLVARAMSRILTIERVYGLNVTKSACLKYAQSRQLEKKLQKEIQQREEELMVLKKKAKLD